MTKIECLVPRQRAVPAVGITSFDGAPISPHGAERNCMVEHRQPNRGDAAVDHLAHDFRRHGRGLPAADVAGPAADGFDVFLFGPTIDVVLNVTNCFHRVLPRNALKQETFHLRQGGAPREIIGILLSLVGMTVNIDGVLYSNMRRVDFTGFILGAGSISGHAPLLSWSGNDIFAHRFISPAIKSNFINDSRFFKAISAQVLFSSLLDGRRLLAYFRGVRELFKP